MFDASNQRQFATAGAFPLMKSKGVPTWQKSFAFSMTTRLTVFQNLMRGKVSRRSATIPAARPSRPRRPSTLNPAHYWPAYLTAARIAKAKKLKLALTAGIGSDHVDLQAAIDRGITVAEVTYCNSISVAEHVVMMILGLVRNYIPSYQWVVKGGWNIADCAARSYDVEGMHVGTVAAGRIGLAVLRRLKPFDMHLHYYDRHRLPEAVEKELNLVSHPSVEDMVKVCDVVTINAPLHPETENLFNDKLRSEE